MNRNDYHSGWDTDQFPNNVPEVALAYYEILKAGGFTTGGTNFDAKLRRQSIDAEDLILAHIGGMDTCAAGLKAAAAMMQDGVLEGELQARYGDWETPAAQAMLARDLEAVAAPAGVMDVVLGNGWPGILLHEAVGHGLEGDFNRKKTSAFSGLMGQRVAAPGVTVPDDGTLPGRRRPTTVCDDCTPCGENVLADT